MTYSVDWGVCSVYTCTERHLLFEHVRVGVLPTAFPAPSTTSSRLSQHWQKFLFVFTFGTVPF